MQLWKRAVDILLVVATAPIWFLLVNLVALAIVIIDRRNPIFVQERIGESCRPFKLVKFSSMTNDRDAFGQLLPDSFRITRLGLFLRASSLDELPSLLNVLKGEMSLVGPRPLPTKYLELFSAIDLERFSVVPGLTGLAQINGRNNLSWKYRLKLDVIYAAKVSLCLDLWILLKTVRVVLTMRGVNTPGYVSGEPLERRS